MSEEHIKLNKNTDIETNIEPDLTAEPSLFTKLRDVSV